MVFKRTGRGAQHWSTDLSRSRKFAKLAGHHDKWFILIAHPKPSQIIVDVDSFSVLAGRYKSSFKRLMTRKDPVDMFNGERYEGEVLTVPATAKVLEISDSSKQS